MSGCETVRRMPDRRHFVNNTVLQNDVKGVVNMYSKLFHKIMFGLFSRSVYVG